MSRKGIYWRRIICVSLVFLLGTVSLSVSQAKSKKTAFQVTALGDSLTYGVGDSHHRGGYCYLIQAPLKKTVRRPVQVHNYGVSGETSQQILARLREKTKIQKKIKNSRIIILTLGGNDVMHALQHYGTKLTPQKLAHYQQEYTANLTQLLALIRSQNARAPIYVYGIYNPFQIYLPQAVGVKKAVKYWNQNTKEVTTEESRVHFVDLSALAQPKRVTYSKISKEASNPLLYKKDHFHPNDRGYKLMTQKLWRQLVKTKKEWSR
ncbi:lipase [Lactobacillus sp. DCY120]|uniref:Lipase n=1 Tax=Bombilactobacillus apium TaxID=2675299 RepID=A0A850R4K2_9LACO|nr:GDSL-type esterase/lipase family protein [Bombilactobacillus apium]NVY95767.1 lipase [Bombilactobacillus apium]